MFFTSEEAIFCAPTFYYCIFLPLKVALASFSLVLIFAICLSCMIIYAVSDSLKIAVVLTNAIFFNPNLRSLPVWFSHVEIQDTSL